MPLLDIEVYTSVKEEADRVSAIMSDLIAGKITAQAAEKLLGAKYSSFARKKLNKSAWTVSKVVQPLQNTLVYNQELMDNLSETAFGSFCEIVLGEQLTELTDSFFHNFLPFIHNIVGNADEIEQRWFEKFFKGSSWLNETTVEGFLQSASTYAGVSLTRKAFAEQAIKSIITMISKSWYISRGSVHPYVLTKEVETRLLSEYKGLLKVDGIVSYRPYINSEGEVEPRLTVDLFNTKIRAILKDKGIYTIDSLCDKTAIGVKSYAGLGVSSFWKIEDKLHELGYDFKQVTI